MGRDAVQVLGVARGAVLGADQETGAVPEKGADAVPEKGAGAVPERGVGAVQETGTGGAAARAVVLVQGGEVDSSEVHQH